MRWWIAFVPIVVMAGAPAVRAQDVDVDFCTMLSAVAEDRLTRVGDVASGEAGDEAVHVGWDVRANVGYLVVVALSAPPTGVGMEPATITGGEAPLQAGTRVALDFQARAAGEITLSFHAPRGTRYHAGLYREPPPRETSLGIRPSARAVRGGGFGAGQPGPRPRAPDCRTPVPERLGGRAHAARPHMGRLVIRGSMPRAAATRVVRGALPSIEGCAEMHGAHDVTLRLVVAPTGRVQAASGDGDARLGGCLARLARTWQFPSTGAGVTVIDVPLTFETR